MTSSSAYGYTHAQMKNYKPSSSRLTFAFSLGSAVGSRFRGALSMPWNREARAITPAIAVKSVFIVKLERSFGF